MARTNLTPEQLAANGRIGAHRSWARCPDRAARTAPARRALEASWEAKADPDGTMTPEARASAAESMRTAHYLTMARRSAEVRRAIRDAA